MHVAVFGDSFATSEHPNSWTNLVGCNVTNFSTNGSSEYRIVKHLKDTDLSRFDLVIVVHTSSNRIYIPTNPLYKDHKTHQHCDLIYLDTYNKPQGEFRNNVVWWFENVFDIESANDIHKLLVNEAIRLTQNQKSIHLTFFENLHPNVKCLYTIWQNNVGTINHLTEQGNQLVSNFIKENM